MHNIVFLDIWWNILIKFSKKIAKSLAKIIHTKVNQDPTKHLSWSFFRKSFLGLRGNSESFQTSKMEPFAKILKNEKPLTIFVKTSILDVEQGSEYASELASIVTNVSFLEQFEYQR